MAVTRRGNVVRITADGDTVQIGKGGFRILAVRLVGGIDASTAVIKDTNTSGHVLFSLKAAIQGVDECNPNTVRFDSEILSITLTGTAPEVFIYLE